MDEDRELNDDDINNYNEKLQGYGIFSYQHRIMNKIYYFIFNTKNSRDAPANLQEICSNSQESVDEWEVRPETEITRLRNGRVIAKTAPATSRYISQTFDYCVRTIFTHFASLFSYNVFCLFKRKLLLDINLNFKRFVKIFPNVNVNYSSFSHRSTKRR